jgi:hypothetical protein
MLISRISLRISSGTGGRPPHNRKRIKNAREEAIETNEHPSVDGTEGVFLGGGSSQNNDLLPQR